MFSHPVLSLILARDQGGEQGRGGVEVLVSRGFRATASPPEVSPTSRGHQVAQTGLMTASSAVPQERLLRCHLSWDVSGWDFPVTDAACADMCYVLGLVTWEGRMWARLSCSTAPQAVRSWVTSTPHASPQVLAYVHA